MAPFSSVAVVTRPTTRPLVLRPTTRPLVINPLTRSVVPYPTGRFVLWVWLVGAAAVRAGGRSGGGWRFWGRSLAPNLGGSWGKVKGVGVIIYGGYGRATRGRIPGRY